MIIFLLYLLLILALLLFLIIITIYTIFLIYSSAMGSPYVATKQKEVEIILKEAGLKKDKVFIELGCGDGRVVTAAVKKYQVSGFGFDINPLLINWARFLAKFKKIRRIKFAVKNIFDVDLSKADYIYLFLMPNLIKKLTLKLEKEAKKSAIVISHGFKIEGWEKYLIKTLPHNPFPTYYYSLNDYFVIKYRYLL